LLVTKQSDHKQEAARQDKASHRHKNVETKCFAWMTFRRARAIAKHLLVMKHITKRMQVVHLPPCNSNRYQTSTALLNVSTTMKSELSTV
jgi:ABC-type Zn2+ transport system substrate-binding protein/surface adhesin